MGQSLSRFYRHINRHVDSQEDVERPEARLGSQCDPISNNDCSHINSSIP